MRLCETLYAEHYLEGDVRQYAPTTSRCHRTLVFQGKCVKVRRYFFTMISVSVILVLLSATHVLTQSRSIKMAVGLSLAPYVIPETNSGISLEIVMGALKLKG